MLQQVGHGINQSAQLETSQGVYFGLTDQKSQQRALVSDRQVRGRNFVGHMHGVPAQEVEGADKGGLSFLCVFFDLGLNCKHLNGEGQGDKHNTCVAQLVRA
jgi:hypothetical protein